MKSLKFLAAECFVQDSQNAKENLNCVSHNLYTLLFKASYLQEKAEVIHDLVQNWPLTELNLESILGKTADYKEDLTRWTCRSCLEACLNGLKDYVLCSSATYAKTLKWVDLTGLQDVEYQLCKCKQTLGKWARTEMVARICYDLLMAMQSEKADASVFDISINIVMNIFVTSRSYEIVVQALLLKSHCPLKIKCLGFRADCLTVKKLFYIIKLVEPLALQKLEIVHNVNLETMHLEVLLSHVSFPELRSLTLPAKTFDVRRMAPEDEAVLAQIGDLLSHLNHLTELRVAFSTLTGRIRKLLSPMTTPLQSLEIANCALNHADMAYLANSLHAEHLESLDLSGHNVADLFPSTFFKLLNRASHTLKSLTLEECNIEDNHVNMMILGLVPCRKLKEFKFLGNPLSSQALKCLFEVFCTFPHLKYIEFPVPRDCYPDNVAYPLDEATLVNYDKRQYEEIRTELLFILFQSNREDIVATTPLFGTYDPDIHETSNELGVFMLQSFRNVLTNFIDSISTSSED
ncbi:leucine-rich repeat-containing protein 14B [Amia ocellicauda]|uniref:leucine-rich repeat-containing protein 14B n=1 Tax=Amia ocellicauda TaxID=2972642 RepID=UPI003463D238|nr:LR14B protein [Amia calva]MBN3301884.1 LR14B protein [Amia calva]